MTGRITMGRATLYGAGGGAWFGLLIGLLLSIFAVGSGVAVAVLGSLAVGAFSGALLASWRTGRPAVTVTSPASAKFWPSVTPFRSTRAIWTKPGKLRIGSECRTKRGPQPRAALSGRRPPRAGARRRHAQGLEWGWRSGRLLKAESSRFAW